MTITAIPIHNPLPFMAGADGAAEGGFGSSIDNPSLDII